jgi:hypothetical protein
MMGSRLGVLGRGYAKAGAGDSGVLAGGPGARLCCRLLKKWDQNLPFGYRPLS